MTRFVVDPAAVIRLAEERIAIGAGHRLVAPTLLRSQVLTMLHESVHAGRWSPADGRDLLARTNAIKIRYLGDAVLRRRAWDIAERLGCQGTFDAEYVALTQLQADALVALDADLARMAEPLVRVAHVDDLR